VETAGNRNEYQQSFWGGGGKGRPVCNAEILTVICEQNVYLENVGNLWVSPACYRDSFGSALFGTGSQADVYEINFRAITAVSGFPLSVMDVVPFKCRIMSLTPNQSVIVLC
jgi:hypothetical protein